MDLWGGCDMARFPALFSSEINEYRSKLMWISEGFKKFACCYFDFKAFLKGSEPLYS